MTATISLHSPPIRATVGVACVALIRRWAHEVTKETHTLRAADEQRAAACAAHPSISLSPLVFFSARFCRFSHSACCLHCIWPCCRLSNVRQCLVGGPTSAGGASNSFNSMPYFHSSTAASTSLMLYSSQACRFGSSFYLMDNG